MWQKELKGLKMNFNDKFLNVCFKIGKILFSLLLVISLFVTVWMFGKTGIAAIKENNVKINTTYNTKELIYEQYHDVWELSDKETAKSEETAQEQSANTKKAIEIFNKFVDDKGLPQELKKEKLNLPDNDEQILPFIKGFTKFYDSFVAEFREILKNNLKYSDNEVEIIINREKLHIYNDSMEMYSSEFEQAAANADTDKVAYKTEKSADLTASLISLAIFILFLFLPIPRLYKILFCCDLYLYHHFL